MIPFLRAHSINILIIKICFHTVNTIKNVRFLFGGLHCTYSRVLIKIKIKRNLISRKKSEECKTNQRLGIKWVCRSGRYFFDTEKEGKNNNQRKKTFRTLIFHNGLKLDFASKKRRIHQNLKKKFELRRSEIHFELKNFNLISSLSFFKAQK